MKKFLLRLCVVLLAGATVFAANVMPKRGNVDIVAKRIIFTSNGTDTGTLVMDTNSGGNVLVYGDLKDGSGNYYLNKGGSIYTYGNFFGLTNTGILLAVNSTITGGDTIFAYNTMGGNAIKAVAGNGSYGIYSTTLFLGWDAAGVNTPGLFEQAGDIGGQNKNAPVLEVRRNLSYGFGGSNTGSVLKISSDVKSIGNLIGAYIGTGIKFKVDSTGDTYVYGNLYDGSGRNYVKMKGENLLNAPALYDTAGIYTVSGVNFYSQTLIGSYNDTYNNYGVFSYISARKTNQPTYGLYVNDWNQLTGTSNQRGGYITRGPIGGSGSSQPLLWLNDFTYGYGELFLITRNSSNKFKVDSTGDTYIYGNLYDGGGNKFITGADLSSYLTGAGTTNYFSLWNNSSSLGTGILSIGNNGQVHSSKQIEAFITSSNSSTIPFALYGYASCNIGDTCFGLFAQTNQYGIAGKFYKSVGGANPNNSPAVEIYKNGTMVSGRDYGPLLSMSDVTMEPDYVTPFTGLYNLLEITKAGSGVFSVSSHGGITISDNIDACTGTVLGTMKFSGDNFYGCKAASGRVILN